MPTADDQSKVQEVLEPGEELITALPGQTKRAPWFLRLGLAGLLIRPKYRVVAVTDRRILVFSMNFAVTAAKELIAQAPRRHLGTPTGKWWKCTALPEPLWIPRRSFEEVEAANAGVSP